MDMISSKSPSPKGIGRHMASQNLCTSSPRCLLPSITCSLHPQSERLSGLKSLSSICPSKLISFSPAFWQALLKMCARSPFRRKGQVCLAAHLDGVLLEQPKGLFPFRRRLELSRPCQSLQLPNVVPKQPLLGGVAHAPTRPLAPDPPPPAQSNAVTPLFSGRRAATQ
eukprot:1195361-Prorocentrum_minimum.AAC.6